MSSYPSSYSLQYRTYSCYGILCHFKSDLAFFSAEKRLTFSGDVGRYDVPILPDPAPIEMGDLHVCESTYGDRVHADEDVKETKDADCEQEYHERSSVSGDQSGVSGRSSGSTYYSCTVFMERI